ncbi:MAG: HlyD family efflux transporter periplasmic adaptor subunit [bacterium]
MSDKSNAAALKRTSLIENLKTYGDKLEGFLSKTKLPPFFRNKFVLVGIVLLILILIFVVIGNLGSDDLKIPTYEVKKENFIVSITESGEIRAKQSITVSAPRIRGNLKIVYLIPEGTYVKAGDVVVKFDPSEALTKLKDAEAQLEMSQSEKEKLLANHKSSIAQMESQLKSAELSYELSKLNLEQMKFEAEIKQHEAKLQHQKNELSFAQTKQEYESRKIIQQSELNKMDIEIKQKRNELDRAQAELESLTLSAPAEGLAVYEMNWSNNGRKYTVGDTPWGGAPIISLPDLSKMESLTNVNEVDVSKIKTGQKVLVKLDAFQDSTFHGTISSVGTLGRKKNDQSNINVFDITVDISEKSAILKPGMTTSNKMVIDEIPNTLFIPQESIFEKNGKNVVYIQNGSSFEEIEVNTGSKGEDYIVITKGIKDGDVVALIDPTIERKDKQTDTDKVELPGRN